jgi:hypothetical protein
MPLLDEPISTTQSAVEVALLGRLTLLLAHAYTYAMRMSFFLV